MSNIFTCPQLIGYSLLIGTLIAVYVTGKFEDYRAKKKRSEWKKYFNKEK